MYVILKNNAVHKTITIYLNIDRHEPAKSPHEITLSASRLQLISKMSFMKLLTKTNWFLYHIHITDSQHACPQK